jgi:tetratricopeptide (TPR) repeat protein
VELERALKYRPPTEVVLDYHVERARHLLNANKAKEALAESEAALELRLDCPPAHEMRGRALLTLKRFEEAEAALDRFLTMGGKASADTFRARGQARMKQGKYADAVDDYTRALEKRPDAEIYQHRGWAHFFADAWKLALRDFTHAIDLDPEPGDAYTGRGLARAMLGDFRAASADADEALERKPATPEMMHNIACIFAQSVARVATAVNEPNAKALEFEYRRRALEAIRQTLALVPAPDRAAFWREKISPDSALTPLHQDSAFCEWRAAYSASPGPR